MRSRTGRAVRLAIQTPATAASEPDADSEQQEGLGAVCRRSCSMRDQVDRDDEPQVQGPVRRRPV